MSNQLLAISLQVDFKMVENFLKNSFLLCPTLKKAEFIRRKNGEHKKVANTKPPTTWTHTHH